MLDIHASMQHTNINQKAYIEGVFFIGRMYTLVCKLHIHCAREFSAGISHYCFFRRHIRFPWRGSHTCFCHNQCLIPRTIVTLSSWCYSWVGKNHQISRYRQSLCDLAITAHVIFIWMIVCMLMYTWSKMYRHKHYVHCRNKHNYQLAVLAKLFESSLWKTWW